MLLLESYLKKEHFEARFEKRYPVGDVEVVWDSSKPLRVCVTAAPVMHLAHPPAWARAQLCLLSGTGRAQDQGGPLRCPSAGTPACPESPGLAGPAVAGLLEISSHHFFFFAGGKKSFLPLKARARVVVC